MSGDVQPRKRKDKKKKKEGTSLGNIHEPIPTQKFKGKSFDEDSEPTPVIGSIDAGEKIHVHNDHGIGGNICVKIIFFCLLGALVAAVGIIFIHSRGSTDVDLPSVEDSRFADYFTGWLDDATDDHGHDEHELAHGDDDGHDEEEDEHGGGEEEEHSGEEAGERSEEEEHGDDAAEEGSPEAGDNEEGENADDDEEEDEDDDEKGVDEDDDEPKLKVVHRFKHFFNQRKRFVREKSEESDVRKRRKVVDVADDDDDDDEEVEKEEEEEEEEVVVVKRSDLRMKRKEDVKKEITMRKRSRKEDKVKEIVLRKRGRKEIEAEEEEEESEEVEDDDEKEESGEKVKQDGEEDEDEEEEAEEEEEESEGNMKEADEENEDDEEEEESGEKVKEDDEEEDESEEKMKEADDDGEEEDESEEKVKEADGDGEEEEESGEKVKEDDEEEDESEEKVKEADDDGEEEDESDEKVKEADEEESDEKVAESDVEDREEDEKDDDEDRSPEADLGLDEIDESEEALKEEERIVRGGEPPSSEEDKELEEVESKIIDIEEKLNQILREKRKEVEQRKMELEEIEIESTMEETREEEVEGAEGGEEDEESASHGVAVKVLVGIALIVVAHLVLIKKWNSLGSLPPDEKTEVDETKEVRSGGGGGDDTEPVISRRQTLVPEAADLNEYFPEEGDEETGEEEEEEEEDEDVEEEEEEEYSEEEEELMAKDDRKWTVDYPNRMANLTRDEDEYTEEEEEEEVEDEEELEDEEEEEEDVEEDDYGWKRLEPARMEVEEEEADEAEAPPIPPPRRSHMTSGERRGGPQGIDDFAQMNEAFDELWDGFDTVDEGEEKAPSGEQEEEEEEGKAEKKAEDEIYKEEFRFAEDQLDNNPTSALKNYELILSRMPESVKALMGRAKALDKIAEKERSNQYLREAINAYRILLTKHEEALTDEEFLLLSERCIDRMRFRGYFKSAIDIHKGLMRKFPDNPKYRNDLAVTYLFLNDIQSARNLLEETLKIWPKNGFALVHYGFVLKTADNNHAEAVDYLMAGIRTKEPGVIDGRFFFHLGDALNRLGRGKEAMEWYDRGVKEGLFLSKYQRSLYNVDRLKGQPWWTHSETTYQDFFKKLEDNWEKIRSEGLSLLNSKGVKLFKEEAENLKDTGDWRQLDLYFRGTRHSNCDRAPFTCSLIASFRPASSCTRGQVKFSVMLPSTHVWPHCGPTNCRLRSHLGLVVPKNTFIRVAEETRSWEEGKVIVFDDSFEHEVWHNGTGARLVLIVDVWHPELTAKERSFLSPI